MKKLAVTLTAALLLSAFGFAAEKETTFAGEIMDSQCSSMGSHDKMLQSGAAKDARQCTLACVKMGGQFVLFDSAHKQVYKLDDQSGPEPFAGEKVKVKGTLDKATNTIHVKGIQRAS